MNSPTPEDLLRTLEEAQAAFAKQEYRLALARYQWVERHIQDDPENLPVIQIEIGWSHYLLQEYPDAIRYFAKALQSPRLNPTQRFDCLRLSGFSYEFAGDPEKASAFLQDALAQEVEETLKRYTYFELGKICFAQRRLAEAKAPLLKARQLFGAGEAPAGEREYLQTTLYYLGFIAFFEGDPGEAEKLFREYVEKAPDLKSQAPGYFGLAHLFYERKEYPALLDVCDKILHLDADFYDKETLAFFLCRGYLELQMWEELEMFLPNLIETYPEGRYQAAYPQLQWALRHRRLPPRSPEA